MSTALKDSITGWRFEPIVQALLALRGIDVISAIGLALERTPGRGWRWRKSAMPRAMDSSAAFLLPQLQQRALA